MCVFVFFCWRARGTTYQYVQKTGLIRIKFRLAFHVVFYFFFYENQFSMLLLYTFFLSCRSEVITYNFLSFPFLHSIISYWLMLYLWRFILQMKTYKMLLIFILLLFSWRWYWMVTPCEWIEDRRISCIQYSYDRNIDLLIYILILILYR